ncbi:4,5-DOPA dioxygenase extradiol [Hymenobacter saemangeumensis]|uniref:4,5-DOPA dioxygenase extradiol n=2 Tax=Hymenobacter saemangeumensis TaxID=1084522 RepID=A0ABP8ILF6_9BACT
MQRRQFLKSVAALPFAATAMNLSQLHTTAASFPKTAPMPVLFIGHGSPMNALEDNAFTRRLRQLGQQLREGPRPNTILVVSAHWQTRGTFVTGNQRPATIHDFGGFPQALFDMQYPAPGSPTLAQSIVEHVEEVHSTNDWGLDHGTWTVLHHLYPQADVPVLQLSLDYTKPLDWHFDFARQLQFLRERGVLIVGSGNIVHNLRESMPRFMNSDPRPHAWATEFDHWFKSQVEGGDYRALVRYEQAGASGRLAVPTLDHYLPTLYTLGLAGRQEPVQHLFEEVSYGGISMRTFMVG